MGLKDFLEDGDQVPEGLVLPAPYGWVSVGLAQEGRPLWVRPTGRGQTAAGMESLNPKQPKKLMPLPCVPSHPQAVHPYGLHGCRVPIWHCCCPPHQAGSTFPAIACGSKTEHLVSTAQGHPAIGPFPSCSLCRSTHPMHTSSGTFRAPSQAIPRHWTTPEHPTEMRFPPAIPPYPSTISFFLFFLISKNASLYFVYTFNLFFFQCHSPKSSHPLPLQQSP